MEVTLTCSSWTQLFCSRRFKVVVHELVDSKNESLYEWYIYSLQPTQVHYIASMYGCVYICTCQRCYSIEFNYS